VGLPYLDHAVWHRIASAIEQLAGNTDVFADGIGRDEVVADDAAEIVLRRSQAEMEEGADRLRRRDAALSHGAALRTGLPGGRGARCRSGSRAPIPARWSRGRTRRSNEPAPSRPVSS